MMCHYKKQQGFSLIELMVVLAIVAVLLSLTGGIVQRNIAQQERLVELEKLNQLINQLSYKAYYGAGPYYLRFEENKVVISEKASDKNTQAINESQELIMLEEMVFKQLLFVAKDYTVSSKGVIFPETFAVILKNDIRQFNFRTIYRRIQVANEYSAI